MSMDFDVLALFWGRVLSPVLFKAPDEERSHRQILLTLTEERLLDFSPCLTTIVGVREKATAYRIELPSTHDMTSRP